MDKHHPIIEIPSVTIDVKPLVARKSRAVLDVLNVEYREKLLCDGITFSIDEECAGLSLQPEEILIRRKNAMELLRGQLLNENGTRRFPDDLDNRVAFSPEDAATTLELLQTTAEACTLILDSTGWHIRLLSKSHLLAKLIADEMIPKRHHKRLILGFLMATLDDQVAEITYYRDSEPLKSLYWLQDNNYRTFVMIGPARPKYGRSDYFMETVWDKIRVMKCEHVWVESITVRKESIGNILRAVREGKLRWHATNIQEVTGPNSKEAWDGYCGGTFAYISKIVPARKLRYLHRVDASTVDWWEKQRQYGAVLLGKVARERNLTSTKPLLTKDERKYLSEREKKVTAGVRASIAAAKALFEIHDYENGRLWSCKFTTFEEYCREMWNFGKSHSYRLLDCGGFIGALERDVKESQSPIGDYMPKTEGLIRPLSGVPKEHRVACWRGIVDEMKPGNITSKVVAQKVKQYEQTLEKEVGNSPTITQGISQVSYAKDIQLCRSKKSVAGEMSKLVNKLRAATCEHNNSNSISEILDQIQSLLD